MQKVAVLGFTPREEVIINAIQRDPTQSEIALFTNASNRALEERADCIFPISNESLCQLKRWSPDLVFLGPDKLSSDGTCDLLHTLGVPCIGADSKQIKIETDRPFLRMQFPSLARYFAPFAVFNDFDETAITSKFRDFGEYVVKYSGSYPQLGGGSKLSGLHLRDYSEGLAFARQSIEECGSVVIEKQIVGIDFSVNALSGRDGSVFFFPENYCYKLRNAGNSGPNTSGTGSIAYAGRLPFLSEHQQATARQISTEVVQAANTISDRPLVSGLNLDFRRGTDGRVYLLEVNARFAGAGTLSTVLDLCDIPLANLLKAAMFGTLSDKVFSPRASCSLGVFTFPRFFPGEPSEDVVVSIPKALAVPKGVNCFTGWVEVVEESEMSRLVILKNSTTQLFQTIDSTIESCRNTIYSILNAMPESLEYRTDIGDHRWLE